MPAPSWENLDDFTNPDDFAISGLLTLASGETRTVVGIFDEPYMNADLGEYELDASQPRFGAAEKHFVGVERGDTLEIDGKVYDILTAPQSDGVGWATLQLGERFE